MKKYITTDKHPELKEGLIFKKDKHDNLYLDDYPTITIQNGKADLDIKAGYIREIQEPKWTDDDMIGIACHCRTMNRNEIIDYLESIKKSKS